METRDQILAAALEVYAQHGFRGATTRRIAHAAGVNEVTVFRHFGSKDALLAEAITDAASQSPSAPLPDEPGDVPRELTMWAQAQIGNLRERSGVIRTCMGELDERPELASSAAIAPRTSFAELATYLRRLRERGMITRDHDVHAAAAMLMGALFADATSRPLLPEIFPPASDAARVYVRLLLRALGVPDQRGSAESAQPAPAPPSVPDATGA